MRSSKLYSASFSVFRFFFYFGGGRCFLLLIGKMIQGIRRSTSTSFVVGYSFVVWNTYDVVMKTLVILMKVENNSVGLTQTYHMLLDKVIVRHPHFGLTSQTTNRIVGVTPEEASFLVSTVGSVQTETGK